MSDQLEKIKVELEGNYSPAWSAVRWLIAKVEELRLELKTVQRCLSKVITEDRRLRVAACTVLDEYAKLMPDDMVTPMRNLRSALEGE